MYKLLRSFLFLFDPESGSLFFDECAENALQDWLCETYYLFDIQTERNYTIFNIPRKIRGRQYSIPK
jgi:hypothetical protein